MFLLEYLLHDPPVVRVLAQMLVLIGQCQHLVLVEPVGSCLVGFAAWNPPTTTSRDPPTPNTKGQAVCQPG